MYVSAVAEHFTYFLASKGYVEDGYYMNKKKLIDVFKDEYLPLYHVRMKPYIILQTLARIKCVKKGKKQTKDTVFFSSSEVQKIVTNHGGRLEGNMKNKPFHSNVIIDLYFHSTQTSVVVTSILLLFQQSVFDYA
jgi:hypothetical protein